MTEPEKCPVCGLLKATALDHLSESDYCWRSYEYCSKTYPYRKTIARLEAERDLLVKCTAAADAMSSWLHGKFPTTGVPVRGDYDQARSALDAHRAGKAAR